MVEGKESTSARYFAVGALGKAGKGKEGRGEGERA